MWRRGSSAIGVVLVVLALASCAGPTVSDGGDSGKSALDLSGADVIDLTYAYDAETLYWPTSPSGLELTELSFGPTEGGYFLCRLLLLYARAWRHAYRRPHSLLARWVDIG